VSAEIPKATANLVAYNLERERRRKEGYRKFLANRTWFYYYYTDDYGTQYRFYPYRQSDGKFRVEMVPKRGKTKTLHFSKRKRAEGWVWKTRRARNDRWRAAQERKQQRMEKHAAEKASHAPTKAEMIQKRIRDADDHVKSLQTRIKRLQTQVKKWNRRKAGLKVALRKVPRPVVLAGQGRVEGLAPLLDHSSQ
jgi:hypothetical protein